MFLYACSMEMIYGKVHYVACAWHFNITRN